MERFGIALKRARIAAKLTQAQLGDLVGVDRTYINKIEGGRVYRPEEETIAKLAAALDMTAADLLATVEPPLMLREDRGLYAVDLDEDPLLQLYNRMSEPDRRRLVAIADALWRLNEG